MSLARFNDFVTSHHANLIDDIELQSWKGGVLEYWFANLQVSSKPRTWRRCVMESLSDATTAELGEVSFQLPAEPLAPTMTLLLGAVRELQRAGGPALPPPARDRLATKLLVRVPCSRLRSQISHTAPRSNISTSHEPMARASVCSAVVSRSVKSNATQASATPALTHQRCGEAACTPLCCVL